MTVRTFLEQNGLAAHVDAFEANFVQLGDLAELSDEDLVTTFGMQSFVARKRFKAAVASLAAAAPIGAAPTPLPPTVVPVLRGEAAGATRIFTAPEVSPAGPPPPLGLPDGLPERLGSYRVLGPIGQGGMGTVVRARHCEEVWAVQQGGDVAIKLIHPHIASDVSFRTRFLTEAALGRRVQHPALVPTWDVLVEGPWLGTVMSFVAGDVLSRSIRPSGLVIADALALLGPIAEALDALHVHGIVHRDLKPGNVVVRPDGRPVLLDLGIAKDLRAPDPLTRTATTLGTSAWMSPEQADAQTVDGATDRYALGMIAYALFSGRMPWPDESTEARVLARKLTGQLEPLEAAAPRVPAHVARAVMRMLATTPQERFPSGAAFIAALREDVEARERAAAAERDRLAKEKARRQAEEAERARAAEAARQKEAAAEQRREAEAAEQRREAARRQAKEADRQRRMAEHARQLEEEEARAAAEAAEAERARANEEARRAAKRAASAAGAPDGFHALGDDQAWATGRSWPVAAVNHAYETGLLITAASYSAPLSSWLVIFSRHKAGQSSKKVEDSAELSTAVKALWDGDKRNLRLYPYESASWRAIASSDFFVKHLEGMQEKYKTVVIDAFPAAALQALWDEGYVVTGCSATGKRWAFTARKPAKRWTQHWKAGSFGDVKEFYAARWKEKDSIVALGYGGGSWFVITESVDRGAERARHTRPDALAETLADIVDDGKQVYTVHADDDGWLVVACKRPGWVV